MLITYAQSAPKWPAGYIDEPCMFPTYYMIVTVWRKVPRLGIYIQKVINVQQMLQSLNVIHFKGIVYDFEVGVHAWAGSILPVVDRFLNYFNLTRE